MPLTILKDWDFNTLDYSKYIHLSDNRKVVEFALQHRFYSRLGIEGTNPNFRPFSYTSKKLYIKGINVICVLYGRLEKDKEPVFCLDIFPDEERFIKHFMWQLDFIVDVQRKRRKNKLYK